MACIDLDTDGAITFQELIIAIMDPSIFQKKDKVLKAFKAFDTDGSGSISMDELKR